MSSWHVVVPIAVFATTGCTRAAPAWVLGPVPLAEHDSVAVGRTLPETAASRPWKTIVALNGRDSARLYHLQGDSTYDVGKVDAEVAHTGVVTALYFEVGQSMPIKRIAERFRKYYGEPSHTCIPMTCASGTAPGSTWAWCSGRTQRRRGSTSTPMHRSRRSSAAAKRGKSFPGRRVTVHAVTGYWSSVRDLRMPSSRIAIAC